MLPDNVSSPALVLTRLPLPFSAPMNVPLLSVSAVPFNATIPPPSRVAISTPLLNKFTAPLAFNTLAVGINEPLSLVNVPSAPTVRFTLVKVPPEAKVRLPAFTIVAPV